jgi:UrcA family protein
MFIFSLVQRARTVLAVAIVSAACLAASAAEDGKIVPGNFTFRFAQDEFATAKGVDKLYGRLTRNARSACGGLGRGIELWRQKAQRECQAELIDKVVAEIGRPDLIARHEKTSHFRLARSIEGGQKAHQTVRRADN